MCSPFAVGLVPTKSWSDKAILVFRFTLVYSENIRGYRKSFCCWLMHWPSFIRFPWKQLQFSKMILPQLCLLWRWLRFAKIKLPLCLSEKWGDGGEAGGVEEGNYGHSSPLKKRTCCWWQGKSEEDGGVAGVEGGDGGHQLGRPCLWPQRLHRWGILRGGGWTTLTFWLGFTDDKLYYISSRLEISKMPTAWTSPRRSS